LDSVHRVHTEVLGRRTSSRHRPPWRQSLCRGHGSRSSAPKRKHHSHDSAVFWRLGPLGL